MLNVCFIHTEAQTSFREQTHYQCWNLQNLLPCRVWNKQKLTYQPPPPPYTYVLSTCFQHTPSSLKEIWQGLGLYTVVVQTEENSKQ